MPPSTATAFSEPLLLLLLLLDVGFAAVASPQEQRELELSAQIQIDGRPRFSLNRLLRGGPPAAAGTDDIRDTVRADVTLSIRLSQPGEDNAGGSSRDTASALTMPEESAKASSRPQGSAKSLSMPQESAKAPSRPQGSAKSPLMPIESAKASSAFLSDLASMAEERMAKDSLSLPPIHASPSCKGNVCYNGGSCTFQVLDANKAPFCSCRAGFKGNFCELIDIESHPE